MWVRATKIRWVFVLTNWQTDNDDNDNDDQGQGKDPVRARNKQLEKQNKDLMEQLAKANATARVSTVKDVLAEKKMPAKLAALIPSTVDATPEAIAAWLEEYKDLFPAPTANEAGKTGETDNGEGEKSGDEQDEEYVAAVNAATRMAQVTNGAKIPDSKPADLMRQLADPTLTQEGLLKLIERHGGGVGVG